MRGLIIALAIAPGCIVSVKADADLTGGGAAGSGAGQSQHMPDPIGPVAHDVAESWPARPDNLPPVQPQQIAAACIAMVSCSSTVGSVARAQAVDFCVAQIEWSAERAIPLSSLYHLNERAEFLVPCWLEAAGDCDTLFACQTTRAKDVYCEEDGCRAAGLTVSCEGSRATLSQGALTEVRDCSRAFSDCDSESPTGCSDRLFTRCPDGSPSEDHCEGDVLLGCDSNLQVTHHDCARLGGSCGAADGTEPVCIYPNTVDECATEPRSPASCEGGQLGVCAVGQRLLLEAPEICG